MAIEEPEPAPPDPLAPQTDDAVRCFVALEAPASLVEALRRVRPSASALAPHARWTPDERLHLTLRFLGTVSAERVALATAALRAQALGPPFRLRPGGAGTFGRPPRVVWIGVRDGADAIGALAHRIDEALEAIGFAARDLPLRPHFTLARAGSRGGRALAAVADALQHFEAAAEHVDAAVLLRSTRVAGRLTYLPLARLALRSV